MSRIDHRSLVWRSLWSALFCTGRLIAQDLQLNSLPAVPPALQAVLPVPERVLAKVNGQEIRGAEVRVRMLSAPLTEQQQPRALEHYLEQAVDQVLIEQFLKSRKVEVPESLVQDRLAAFRQKSAQLTGDAAPALDRMGLDEASLERQVRLALGWLKHAQSIITDEQLRQYFREHQEEFDGTRVPVRQVFQAVSPTADESSWRAAEEALRAAPVPEKAEDLGQITRRNQKLPQELIRAAFEARPGEWSEVIRTPLGVHRLFVGDKIPGLLSLEDVRLEIFPILSQQLWEAEVQRQRQRARIQILGQ